MGDSNYSPAPQVTQTVNVVGFTFDGFSAPIDMSATSATVWNKANAGQAIPVKWRLTLNGVPVSSLASFVGLFSYDVSCSTGTGDIDAAIEEYAPSASGLIYDGDGNFHFNWKTASQYKNACRVMYLSFSDGSVSKLVNFKFK
ncbi:MAG TPA: PxKF domain-containing protein [Vicinamibacterales bacterium]|nr:PxKF domain-containing protein [Vicinamibacterales bacterium]